MAVIELRQYTLRPGQRDVLIDVFDSYLVESQEAVGMRVIGQFLDLDRPDRFVWLRGFENMEQRERSLAEFYGGPVWREHREAANATMVATDDVLLLRPARPGSAFALDGATRSGAAGFVAATILYLDGATDEDAKVDLFEQRIAPAVAEAGGSILGYFVTEPSENTFPGLPIREGEHVLVWFVGFADRATFERAPRPTVESKRQPDALRLAPTSRSLLDGNSTPIGRTREREEIR